MDVNVEVINHFNQCEETSSQEVIAGWCQDTEMWTDFSY